MACKLRAWWQTPSQSCRGIGKVYLHLRFYARELGCWVIFSELHTVLFCKFTILRGLWDQDVQLRNITIFWLGYLIKDCLCNSLCNSLINWISWSTNLSQHNSLVEERFNRWNTTGVVNVGDLNCCTKKLHDYCDAGAVLYQPCGSWKNKSGIYEILYNYMYCSLKTITAMYKSLL